MKDSTYILEARSLTIGYTAKKNSLVVAENIHFELSGQKFVALLGKNGIGKSTLLRTLTNVQPALTGVIKLNNEDLTSYSSRALSQKISLVLTERIPDSNLSVYELIALGRQPYTDWLGNLTEHDRKFIDFAIESTHVGDLLSKRHYELSDGQLQKVMIARALAQNTEIIILDEPTAHLDMHHKIEVFQLLQELVKKFKKTVITSTHEVQLALQLSDELWLMNEESFRTGQTETLIETNELSSLFNSELIKFDRNSRQFIIKG